MAEVGIECEARRGSSSADVLTPAWLSVTSPRSREQRMNLLRSNLSKARDLQMCISTCNNLYLRANVDGDERAADVKRG